MHQKQTNRFGLVFKQRHSNTRERTDERKKNPIKFETFSAVNFIDKISTSILFTHDTHTYEHTNEEEVTE